MRSSPLLTACFAVLMTVVVSLVVVAPAPAAVSARSGREDPCRPDDPSSPSCQVWTAKVVSVNDGDTIGVDLDGDGTRRIYQVRFTGIQAMEETRYSDDPAKLRGQCHAVTAALFVHRLMRAGRWRVRLTSQQPRSDSRGRLFRYLAVRTGGRWRDVGQALMARGLTLWMNEPGDPLWNDAYNRLGQAAALKHIGLFDTTTCGSGPAQDIPLKTWVMSDPPGPDTPDGEWVKIQNLDPARAIDLGRWWVRDSGLRRYTFRAGATLGPRQTLTVHVGSGTDTALGLHWRLHQTIFENAGGFAGTASDGDGAYLFDPQGDLRSWSIYPCLVSCSDPAQGALRVTAHPRGVEYAEVVNVSGRPIDLYGYQLSLGGGKYAFAEGSILQAGETMTVDVAGSAADDTALVRHAGIDGPYLRDSGGTVTVENFQETPIACSAWGMDSC
jgi:endonuclease YncB( thermonuclease family)